MCDLVFVCTEIYAKTVLKLSKQQNVNCCFLRLLAKGTSKLCEVGQRSSIFLPDALRKYPYGYERIDVVTLLPADGQAQPRNQIHDRKPKPSVRSKITYKAMPLPLICWTRLTQSPAWGKLRKHPHQHSRTCGHHRPPFLRLLLQEWEGATLPHHHQISQNNSKIKQLVLPQNTKLTQDHRCIA